MVFFRYMADMVHLLSFVILITKIRKSRNSLGISSKTQEIFLIVFLLRYSDLFMYYVSLYNTIMKIGFICATIYTIFLLRVQKPYCNTYDKVRDSVPYVKVIFPLAAVLTLFIHSEFGWWEMLWSYTLWLEAFAIFPQLYMVYKIHEIENLTSHYVGALGAYRAFYLIHWITTLLTGQGSIHLVSIVAGVVQTALYLDFFYYYLKSLKEGKRHTSIPLPL